MTTILSFLAIRKSDSRVRKKKYFRILALVMDITTLEGLKYRRCWEVQSISDSFRFKVTNFTNLNLFDQIKSISFIVNLLFDIN